MGRFENFTPPTLGSELSTSEITMVEELTALANSGTGEFIRKSAGSLVNATLSETIALSGLSDVAISSVAQGNIIYYNGSSWVNLPVGTTGQFLQTQGTGVNPRWADENPVGTGTVTSVSVVTANGVSGSVATATTTPAITLTLGAITPSSVNVSGLTASEIVITDGSKNLVSAAVATYPSLTELTYVKGVTSAIQTQLGTKVTSGGALGTPSSGTGTNITGIPAANILAGSFGAGAYVISTSLQAATIELGAATDTTLSRVSAGVIAVEGVNVVLTTVATLSSLTTVGTLIAGNADAIVSAASLTLAGKVELATTAEINTGSDSTRAIPIDQYVASNRNVRYILFRVKEKATDWDADATTAVGGDLVIPFTGTIVDIEADSDTAGTTGTAIVDVNLNGSTIMTTDKLKWDSTEKSTRTYSGNAPGLTTTAVTAGDIITLDIDTNHTTKSKGLTLYIGVRLT